jgi:cytidylate kinase
LSTNTTVILISGSPGAGKTTLAERISENMNGVCVHIEGDMLYNMVKKGWIHPCDDYDKFFLNILWDNMVSLIKNFTIKNINVVVDYVFSKEQLFSVVDRIKNSEINIKVVVVSSNIDIIIKRDKQRSGVAYVGEDRIRQIVEDFNSDIIPERYILENDDANLDNLVNTVLYESRFTVQ